MNDLISREEAIEAIEEYADRLQMVNWKENPNVPYKVHSLNWCINTIRDLPSIDTVNHTADYDEKNDILFVHLSPDNSNSYGEEIDKNIIIMRDMDNDKITGVMLYGFNKYVKHGRWEMKEDPYGFFDEIPVCSECGCTTKLRETYRFCPNCGARMDERKES